MTPIWSGIHPDPAPSLEAAMEWLLRAAKWIDALSEWTGKAVSFLIFFLTPPSPVISFIFLAFSS